MLKRIISGLVESRQGTMTSADQDDIDCRYEAPFVNLARICLPEIMFKEQFAELVTRAIETGQPDLPATVTAVFPNTARDY
jgi:hypothetical protein